MSEVGGEQEESTGVIDCEQEILDTPIAELERFGLHTQIISSLEKYYGLYMRDILNRTMYQLEAIHPIGSAKRWQRIRAAIVDLIDDMENIHNG
jgi:hypothetical protein